MVRAYRNFWNNIFNFSGTANRPDYWWAQILNYLLAILVTIIIQLIMGHPINDLYTWGDVSLYSLRNVIGLIVWLGTWSLKVRRLHDSDHSGWWILIELIPFIGWIWFLILMLLPSRPNRWSTF